VSRHNASRRRQYGRRQHEVRERRRTETWRPELDDEFAAHDESSTRNPGTRMFGFWNGGLTLEGNG
jgi:hypothetical protein